MSSGDGTATIVTARCGKSRYGSAAASGEPLFHFEGLATSDEGKLTLVQLDVPVSYNMTFGHNEPMCILPYGVIVEANCKNRTFSILESGVIGGSIDGQRKTDT